MIRFADDFIERLNKLHNEVKATYAGLPQEALDWVPGDGMNSFNVLVTHLAGAERFWIGDMVGQDSSDRVRSSEFEAAGLTAVNLDQRLDDVLAHSNHIMGLFSLDMLDQMRQLPDQDRAFSVAWCLLHAMEHTAVHVGHLQLMRQLWLQQHPI